MGAQNLPEVARTVRGAGPQTGHWFCCSWVGCRGRKAGDITSSSRCGGERGQRPTVLKFQRAGAGGSDVIPAPVGR